MGFALSVNLEYMFHEAGDRLEDRMAAAAKAGFDKVEIFTTANRDVPSLKAALADTGCQLVSCVADPRTQLVNKDTHDGFRTMFRKAAEDALELGCRRMVVGSGPAVPYMKRPVQIGIVSEAIASALPICEELDFNIMLEPVNTRMDHPGVLFSQTVDVEAVIANVQSPRVRILYDLYHSVVEGENPAEVLPRIAPLLEHVQVADAPGRGEPGSGAIDWSAMLGHLKSVGYNGLIGVECSPTTPDTAAALAHFKALAEAA